MRKLKRQEEELDQRARQQREAETLADTEHPSHYEARKDNLRGETELRAEAAPADGSRDEESRVEASAQPAEDFSGLELKPPS